MIPHFHNHSRCLLYKTPGSSSARLTTQRAQARVLDAWGFAGARICGQAQGSACLRRLPNGRAGVDHTSQSCTTLCRTASRRRYAESARLPVRPAVGVGRTMRARCALAHTDACPESSSAARNSGPMGLDNVDHQRQLQILAASLPLAWMSLRARRRTVARSAVARFSADMEVITCAHVHVQELKQLTCCPFTRSSIKRVDPCTGSLASPLHVLSPSSSSTFKSFANSMCTFFTDLRDMCVSFREDAVKQLLGDGDPRNLNLLLTTYFTTSCGDPPLPSPHRDLQLSLFKIGDPPLSLKKPGPTVVPQTTGTQG